MIVKPSRQPSLRVLAIVEATEVNAVAKNVLSFCRGVVDLNQDDPTLAPIEVSIATFYRVATSAYNEASNAFITAARELGITVDVLCERFRFDRNVISALKEVVARRAPDVIATHNVKAHFLTRLCQLHVDRRWVAFHHGYTCPDLRMRLYNQLDRWSLMPADQVIAVCGPFARQMRQRGIRSERITVQHNSIGPVEPPPEVDVGAVRERLSIDERDHVILTVGRLSREKAHIDLVSAFTQLRRLYPEIRTKLVIAGEGPERPTIEGAVRRNGIEEHVRFAGYVHDARSYYAAADVFALPSRSEGSPYVLLEAMAAGIPIAATAVGGVPEILANGQNALLVPPGDSEALAGAIFRLIKDPEFAKRMVINARALVSTRFSLECYVRSVSNIYRSVVRRPPTVSSKAFR